MVAISIGSSFVPDSSQVTITDSMVAMKISRPYLYGTWKSEMMCSFAWGVSSSAWREKEITEDELKTLEKDIQKATDDAVKHIDEMTANKEKEILEV